MAATNFLTNLLLGNNNLSGTVPVAVAASSQLTNLDISDNPWILGTLPDMRYITCHDTLLYDGRVLVALLVPNINY